MKFILWSEKIYKNTWEEQGFVLLQIYFLINLLNHRVNIIFTASVIGNVTINRTGTFRLLHVCFCHVDQGKDLPSQRYRKTKRLQ